MKVAITGAYGFLGWHLRCAFIAGGLHEIVSIGRAQFADADHLAGALNGCDAVVHLAGVNRSDETTVEEQNIWLATTLAAALRASSVRAIIYGNSIHSGGPSAFGRGKQRAARVLFEAAERHGATFSDVRLPNIFGENGRPDYNSVVATFCRDVAVGRTPGFVSDKALPLLHAQDAADVLVSCLGSGSGSIVEPVAEIYLLKDVLARLMSMSSYPVTGSFPDLSTRFDVALFNTFQSYCFPGRFPIPRIVHSDARGELFEAVRATGTDGLSFVSTTRPVQIRGQHFHRRKIERFVVLDGEAEIRLEQVGTGRVVNFAVSGRHPVAVDMATLWAHSIQNTGRGELTTMFWTNELYDPSDSDTYPFEVHKAGRE